MSKGKLSLVPPSDFRQVSTHFLALKNKNRLHHDQIHGNMLHLEQNESGVIDVKDSDDLYEIVPMNYFK